MGEKIRATTIERPRHYLLIVYSAFLVYGVTASEKDFFRRFIALLHIVQIHQSSSNLGILVFFVRN